jgi:adenylate cyclase
LLLGAIAMMHRTDYHDFDKARLMLEHLIERSKRHPVPYAWLAQWHVLKVSQGWSSNVSEEHELALSCSKRALDIEPNNSLALTMEGLVYTNLRKELAVGLDRYELALANNPNESMAWLLKGMLHAFEGEREGKIAFAHTSKAVQLSPLDPTRYFYDSLSASAAIAACEYEAAVLLAKRSLRANRTHTSTYRALAIAQAMLGDINSARATTKELMRLDPNLTIEKFKQNYPGKIQSPQYAEKLAQALEISGVPHASSISN